MKVSIAWILIIILLSGANALASPKIAHKNSDMENARSEILNSLLEARGLATDTLGPSMEQEGDNGTKVKNRIIQALFPLIENKMLDDAAQAICNASVSNSFDGSDDNNTLEYLATFGYKAEEAHIDKTGLIMQEYVDPEAGSKILINTYLKSNLEQVDGNASAIFNNDYAEIGIGFCGGVAKLTASEPVNLYMMVILLARPEGPQPNWIQCGHVFFDLNNNHVYDKGEGLADVRMTDDNGTLLTTTLSEGQYCFKRPLGEWTLYVEGFPFSQDYYVYNILLSQRRDGILYQDIPLLLTQDQIYKLNADE